jgi:MFS family permease
MENPQYGDRKKLLDENLQVDSTEKLITNEQNQSPNINHPNDNLQISHNTSNGINNQTDFEAQIESSQKILNSQNPSDPSTPTIYDQILEEYGYGWEIWKVIIAVICIYTVDSYFVNFFPSMVTSYKTFFNLTDNQISLIGMIFFLSKMVGCIVTGFVTSKSSRETYLKFSIVLLFLLNIGLAFINKLWFFFVMRVISAFLSGFLEVIANNFLCELLPTYLRSFTLNSSYVGFSLSQIFLSLIMLFTMPNLEASGISITHLYYAIFNFVCIIFIFLWITDSPRNLILHGLEDRAFGILLKLKKGDQSFFTPEIKSQIITEIKEGANAESKHSNSFFEIFTKKEYVVFTICIGIGAYSTDVLLDGGKLVNNLVLEKINIENKVVDYHGILIENLIMNLVNPISCFIFGYLTEVKVIGRKLTIFIGITLMGISLLPCLFYPSTAGACFIVFSFFNNVNNVIFTYASEFYPTRIRDIALGWVNFLGYAGSASSQYYLVLPMKIHWKATIILMMAIAFFSSIVICLNPYETYGQALDLDSSKLEKIENYKASHDDEKQKLVTR